MARNKNKSLMDAVESGDELRVQQLLSSGAQVNYHDWFQQTALYVASGKGHANIVKILLQHNADPNITNRYHQTALYLASEKGHFNIVKILLEHKADPNRVYQHNQTSLYVASEKGHVNIVKILLQHNGDPNITNMYDQTALHVASEIGHVDIVEILLQHNADPNIINKYGQTVLHIAGHGEIVITFLQLNIHPDIKDMYGQTALYKASEKGCVDIVKILLQFNADPNIKDKYGHTALYVASDEGHADVVEILLQHNADPSIKDRDGETALYIGSEKGHFNIVKTLLQYNANPNIRLVNDQTALYVATEKGHVDIVKILLQHNNDPNIKDKDGNTLVHCCSAYGHSDVLRYFLEEGLSIDTVNKLGETPIHLAKNAEIAECLISNGANPNVLTNDGNTVLHSSCTYGHYDVLHYWLKRGFKVDTVNKLSQTPMNILQKEHDDGLMSWKRNKCQNILQGMDYHDSVLRNNSDHDAQINDRSPEASSSSPELTFHSDKLEDNAADQEDKRMAELAKQQILKEGKIELRILKCILLGGPGIGKTTTILRLLGQLNNLSTSSYNPVSTGIDTAKVVRLRHQLYTESAEFTVMIEEEWKALSLNEQISVLLHCLENLPEEMTNLESCSLSTEHNTSTNPTVETILLIPLSESDTAAQSSTPTLSPSTPKPTDDSRLQEFKEIEDLIAQSNWKEAHQKLSAITDNTTMMYITDAGGQPEFFDIIPLVVSGPSLCLIFLNLALSLISPFEVSYRHKGPISGRSGCIYNSSYTPLDMIQQVLASLESLNQSKQRSGAFIIGTHFDKVKEELVLCYEEIIKAAIKNTSFYKRDFLRQYTDNLERKRLIYPLDNLNGNKAEINTLRLILTEAIRYLFEAEELPSSWGFFHLLLRFKYEGKLGYCSIQEAIQLAGCCGIYNENDVKDVLKYFHSHFGTIFYFGDVESLKNIVICDPNLVFHPITKLVAESFGANPLEPNTAEEIRKTGEIKWNFFEKICKMDDKTKLVNANMVYELLKSLNIITEIPSNGDIRLFMSCLLHPIPLEELKTVDILAKQDPSPLVFTFHPSGYQPVGLFHILLAQLLKKGFSLHTPRYRNKVFLLYEESLCIEILSTPLNLEIRITNATHETYLEARKLIQNEIESIIKNTPHMRDTTVGIAFYCPNGLESQSASSAHLAKYITCSRSHSKFSKASLHCSVCIPPVFTVNDDKYNIWFENFHSQDDTKAESAGSTYEILRKYSAKLCDSIPDPIKLVNDLCANNLISPHIKDQVTTLSHATRYDRCNMLMNELRHTCKYSTAPNIVQTFCNILEQQENPDLDQIICEMEKEI